MEDLGRGLNPLAKNGFRVLSNMFLSMTYAHYVPMY